MTSRPAAAVVLEVVLAALAAGLLPLALAAPSAARAAHRIDGSSFERSLSGWAEATSATRLDRVAQGRGAASSAARLRPPPDHAATVGLTDAPALVRSTHAKARYIATAWVRATSRAVRPGPVAVRLSLGELTGTGSGPTAWQRRRLSDRHWHKVSVPFTSRKDGRRVDLTVRAIDVPRGGAVLVDDIRLVRSPLPEASDRVLAGTRFGASVDEGRIDWLRALRKSDRRYSPMEVVRVFEPVIRDGWSGRLGDVNRPMSVSFVAPAAQVLSGEHDAALRAWFRDAPARGPIWWTYWHEPEDNVAAGDVSARRYRAAWRHINAIAQRVGGANLHPTLVLMAWTAKSASGRQVRDYYPGDFIDVMAWDGYNPPGARGYASAREIFGPAAATTKRLGNRFALAEVGSVLVPGDDGSRRAQWLVNVARFAATMGAPFASYWDAKIPDENYQLRDLPSRLAWRSVVKD